MTDIDHDRIYEIALDSQLGVTTTTYRHPGPTWPCNNPGCHMVRTTACKPAGCANDRIDTREFRAQLRGHSINDNLDFENGFDQ
jgi:hypothetical protein